MVTGADIVAFLEGRGITDVIADTIEPPMPDRVLTVLLTGGAGTTNERLFDRLTVQLRIRGNQQDPADSEAFAAQVDAAMMGAQPPLTIGGKHVVSVDYVGGPPAFLLLDPGLRTTLVCNYLVQVERDPAAR